MSAETELMKLYSARILALAADIPCTDPVPDAQARATQRSPLCGSTISVELSLDENGRVSAYGQNVKACALGQAAAAVVGGAIIGVAGDQLRQARDALDAMLKSQGDVPQAPFEGLEILLPARDFRNRHASIMLSLNAICAALDDLEAQSRAIG